MKRKLEPAYIAGFIDGEGCIMFSKQKNSHLRNTYHYVPRIIIGNTNKEILEQIKEQYGGSIQSRKKQKGWKQGYVLDMCSRKVYNLAKDIKDFVRIKSEQINLLLEIYDTGVIGDGYKYNRRRRNPKNGQFESRLPTKDQMSHYAVQEEYYLKFRELNKRGTTN